MFSLRKVGVVARFEWAEAVHSRLAVVVLLMYGASAALGSYVFLKLLAAAEEQARDALASSTGVDPSSLPVDLVRKEALPLLAQLVGDPQVGDQLLQMQPLSIFYGFLALNSVALLVLATSTGAVAGDVATGASRFVLVRCDRLSWALGKFVGQAGLLAAGLLTGALLAGGVGQLLEQGFQQSTWLWLFRTSFRAWVYGLAYLGLFIGVSLTSRSIMRARAIALVLLVGLGVVHAVLDTELVKESFPPTAWLAWAFPSHHQLSLWSPDWGQYLAAVTCLVLVGSAGFAAGFALFERRDA